MPDICGELAELLSTVQRPGDFFASGRLELLTPRLTVDGVGQIALPLLPAQAEQLIALAELAPYGRGAATIVDTSVRRTWQIGPDRVRIDGKHWQATLDRAVALAISTSERSAAARPTVSSAEKTAARRAASSRPGRYRDTEGHDGRRSVSTTPVETSCSRPDSFLPAAPFLFT